MIRYCLALSIILIWVTNGFSQTHSTGPLRRKIEKIICDKQAFVGVSIMGSNGKDTMSINGDRHFPMQSVFKFHIALAVLGEVDNGNLSLDQLIKIETQDYFPSGFWNPLRDDFPQGGDFTIRQLIQYSVAKSDNTACDVLISMIGSPGRVEQFFKEKGIHNLQIVYNEKDMQSKWENMFENWTTPGAATETLKMFYDNQNGLLSQSSHDFFWRTNKETITGQKRIRGRLPKNTIVAHKTGWSGTNDETGITGAVNDIGIVFLPDGSYFIISVFVTDSKESLEVNERIIADISKAAYDYFLKQTRQLR